VKPTIYAQALRTIGRVVLAGCLLLLPAAVPAQDAGGPAAPRQTTAGFNRSIRIEHFKGLDKPVILRMQQQLAVVYRNLPEWQVAAQKRGGPLHDGVVGSVTLEWLQRYAFHFKFAAGARVGMDMPAHLDRLAAFSQVHPDELAILLGAPFEAWDAAQPAGVKEEDYAIRRQGDEAPLIALVNRYRASLVAAPPLPAAGAGYYTWMLEQKDLEMLGGKADVAALLATFKDQRYKSVEAFKVALDQAYKKAFPARQHLPGNVWPVIKDNLRAFDGYMLDAAALERLKKGGMSLSAMAELRTLTPVYLKSRDEYDTFITGKIASGELTVTDDELVLLPDTTRVIDNYHLDQQALDTIATQLGPVVQYAGLPAGIVGMLMQMKEVDYSDVDIFHSAVKSKIAFGLGMCKLNAPVNNAYVAGLAISNDALDVLKEQMVALGTKPAQFDGIPALRDKREACTVAEKSREALIIDDLYKPYLKQAIETAAQKKLPDEFKPVDIQVADCGCALDDLVGVVYGFYPYWWPQKGAQAVNFRALNRMAYYGLTVDDAGAFHLGNSDFDLHDGSEEKNKFIRTARQYNAGVDWMIQKNDWSGWARLDATSKKAVLHRIVDNISTLLNAPLTNPAAVVKRHTTFFVAPPRRGDGVTLYFTNFPPDAGSTALFNDFYARLCSEMDKHDLWLNLLVTQKMVASVDGGAFGLANLINLRKLRNVAEQRVSFGTVKKTGYLLVLLDEPSADAKKRLRQDLENDQNLHGAERADFLRNLLPVLHFDDKNWQQLDDDIVYARDNFGGVGLWAPDLDNMAKDISESEANQSCLDSQRIVVCLLKNMRKATVADSLPGDVEAFVCVHRWVLQWVMLFLVATAIVLTVLFFTSCKVQAFIKKYFLWVQLLVALPALLVFILLLLYDPFFVNVSKGNLPFFISAGIIMLGVLAGYRFWRAQRQVPQRERGMPQREGVGFPIVVSKIATDNGGFQWVILNRGTGYAIIKKVEILLDGNPVADARTALESVMESAHTALWKSVPLVGQKLEAGKQIVGLSIPAGEAARAFEQKLKAHDLAVKITYSGPNNEHWASDGNGIMSVAGVV
jgi:hypothetical protein